MLSMLSMELKTMQFGTKKKEKQKMQKSHPLTTSSRQRAKLWIAIQRKSIINVVFLLFLYLPLFIYMLRSV